MEPMLPFLADERARQLRRDGELVKASRRARRRLGQQRRSRS